MAKRIRWDNFPQCPVILKRFYDDAWEVVTYTKKGHELVLGRYSNPRHQQQLWQIETQDVYNRTKLEGDIAMPKGFVPKIGNHYDRIKMENERVSRTAEYFENVVNRSARSPESCFVLETNSSVLIWYNTDEHSTVNMIKHLIANGISFSYDFAEFTAHHAKYIEDYNYADI